MGFDGNSGFSQPITGNEGELTIDQIQSDNFVAGSEGWQIQADGDAEFNEVTIRNSLIENGPILFYSGGGVPTPNGLLIALAPFAGVDIAGNHYSEGLSVFDGSGNLLVNLTDALQSLNQALLTGLVFAYQPNTAFVPETWHSPSLGSNWAAGDQSGGYQALQYMSMPDTSAWLLGEIHSTSVSPNATLFTLPAGYFNPNEAQRIPVAQSIGTAVVGNVALISTSGAVSLLTAVTASGTNIVFDTHVRTA